jgi:indolepyruvate decarboxylase
MTVAEYLIARLKQAGLDHLFAVPGDYASPFLKTLDVSPEITRIPNINELGSGFPSNSSSLSAALDAAWDRIEAATLPILWVGVEIQRFGLQDTMQAIVDASGMCFTTTSLGKTALDESQPHFIGTYSGPASPLITRAVMAATDCPVALGTIITDDYLNIMASRFAQMIEVNDQEARVGSQYYTDVTLKDFLEGLLARFQADNHYPRQYQLPAVTEEEHHAANPENALSYNIFFDEISAFLKNERLLSEIILVLGESTSLYVFGNLFGMPRDGCVAQAAWGSLGHDGLRARDRVGQR